MLQRNGWHRDRMDRETPYFTYLVRRDAHMWNCNRRMTTEKKVRTFFFTGSVAARPERETRVQFAGVLGTNTWQQYLVTSCFEPRYNVVASFSAAIYREPRGCNFSLALLRSAGSC